MSDLDIDQDLTNLWLRYDYDVSQNLLQKVEV